MKKGRKKKVDIKALRWRVSSPKRVIHLLYGAIIEKNQNELQPGDHVVRTHHGLVHTYDVHVGMIPERKKNR